MMNVKDKKNLALCLSIAIFGLGAGLSQLGVNSTEKKSLKVPETQIAQENVTKVSNKKSSQVFKRYKVKKTTQLRSGPGYDYKMIGKVEKGRTFNMSIKTYYKGDVWYKIKGSNKWVKGKDLYLIKS